MNDDVGNPQRVMVILAHPDDPEFFCGGTVGRWAKEGREIIYVLATHGEGGSDDPRMTREQLACIREEEQRAAARVLGVHEVVFLDYPDGLVIPSLDLRRDLTRQIRRWRPGVVITCDPTLRYRLHYINHPDHRAVGDAALDAIFPDARNRLQFPDLLQEGLEPHRVREVYIAGAAEPDTEVDITDSLGRKVAALREHRSQISDLDGLEARLREWHRVEGEDGRPRYVERFRRIVLG
ncbi:MAG: PIG-L deacetylase family protein [Anaerolineae bacterium]|jgi:LmbE family N-acetylglucosaminyl deacetylase